MTPHTEEHAHRLRAALANALETNGELTNPAWRKAFEAVPRHGFLPEFWAVIDGKRHRVAADAPDWLPLVYSDEALVTQMTDGVATSSSTAPGLMVQMLEALDVEDDHRVLEIATGTGYNAALLSERLSSRQVTTVEVDAELVRSADERLKRAGYAPLVVTADGRAGWPDRAPYDRIVATCGFTRIPYPWIEQVKPGGIIVSPLGSGTVRLAVARDGVARGYFLPTGSWFMAARGRGETGTAPHPGRPGEIKERPPRTDPAAVAADDDFRFLISLAVPGTTWSQSTGDTVELELWAADGSWTRVTADFVQEGGPRALWSDIEHAHRLYQIWDRPTREDYGVTVTPKQQRIWVDSEQQGLDLLPLPL